jgi:hypothetical protein
VTPTKPRNFSWPRDVVLLEMYCRFVVLTSFALGGVLAGCSSSTTITVQAGTRPSMETSIQTKFRIGPQGTYHYELTFARIPPQPGAQPEVCLPITDFDLIDEGGGTYGLTPPRDATGEVSGSFYFTAGTWTGSSRAPGLSVGGVFLTPNPPGTFYGGACPWSLTLTPSI